MGRSLIYFVIGGEGDYAKLLLYCINTVRCYQENDEYDIMVMCDESYADILKGFPVQHIHITSPNPTIIHASMRKTDIFSFSAIREYEKVLYLDCDIVVCGNLNNLMESVTRDDLLYVVPESTDLSQHTSPFFQMQDIPYDGDTLIRFSKNDIYPFNCGQFAFKVSDAMEAHFNTITDQIRATYDPSLHFYEQCFMNNHFNRLGAVSYEIKDHVSLLRADVEFDPDTQIQNTVNHFFVASVPYMTKLQRMRQCHRVRINRDQPTTCDSRNVMNQHITLGNQPSIAEIGVFRGEFSRTLIEMYNPLIMYMIDPWEGQICSGDMNGNNIYHIDGEVCYKAVSDAFGAEPSARIIRKYSTDVTIADIIPSNSLDLVYIDGDHSYKGVLMDLNLSLNLVKSRGFVCGHDYAINSDKTTHTYEFGVKQAVQDFCVENGFRVCLFMMDGCISFAIRTS